MFGQVAKMKSIEFLKEHCKFNEPTDCYIIIAISRKKDTPEITNSTEIVFRDVVKSVDEIEKKYLKLKACIKNYKDIDGKHYPFYLYIMLNPANARKATIELLSRITGWLDREQIDKQVNEHYKRTYAEFYSCLMVPKCRGSEKWFMVDYDDSDRKKAKLFVQELLKFTSIELIQKTRHGYHIKCKPFDRRLFKFNAPYEIKTDSLMFVEYIKNGKD
jgi:hypothetical protein